MFASEPFSGNVPLLSGNEHSNFDYQSTNNFSKNSAANVATVDPSSTVNLTSTPNYTIGRRSGHETFLGDL